MFLHIDNMTYFHGCVVMHGDEYYFSYYRELGTEKVSLFVQHYWLYSDRDKTFL